MEESGNSGSCRLPLGKFWSFHFRRLDSPWSYNPGVYATQSVVSIHPLPFIRVLQMSQWSHPQDVSPLYKGYRSAFIQHKMSYISWYLDSLLTLTFMLHWYLEWDIWTKWCTSTFSSRVVLHVGASHLERLTSLEEVAMAKGEIFRDAKSGDVRKVG